MGTNNLLTALALLGLAFVSFQVGGIFWGIVLVLRLEKPRTTFERTSAGGAIRPGDAELERATSRPLIEGRSPEKGGMA